MLKQTVNYTDFDDNEAIETLYFNLTKSELTENLYLQDELQKIRDMMEGERRDLEVSEITKMIDLVKTFMRLSYGTRSADGKRFIKSDEQWTEFTQTGAYDAFLMSLFEEPNKAVTFMSGILPLDLREKAKVEMDRQLKAVKSTPKPSEAEDSSQLVGPTVTTAAPSAAIRNDISESTVAIPAQSDQELEEFKAWKAANVKSSNSD